MALPIGIRGANPIWSEVNLQGQQFDDTYYLYVLQNTIPYIPATVYHDPELQIEWTNPIQFLGNGTLPIDIFYTPNTVYRLEFRQNNGIDPPSQNDALIYEVDNYVPGSGGGSDNTITFPTSNQITNPQFADISFASPFSLSGTDPSPIEVAPGWFLELAGTGTVTLTQVPFNNSEANPTNAPYALQLALTGWTNGSVYLRQRFQQNGMLWANKYVSSSITAAITEGVSPSIEAQLFDSEGNLLTTVLTTVTLTASLNEYTGVGQLPPTINADVPPAAYIDYKLSLPSNGTILVTSIQLIVQDTEVEPSFTQDSIDRQIDHTFHYYRDSILLQPKDSLLCGWNFGLNPWQTQSTSPTTLGTNVYTADQTIVIQQAYVATGTGSAVSVSQGSAAQRQGFVVTAVTASNQFAILQYIDPATIRPYWNYYVSSLARARIFTTYGTAVRFKMRLIVNNSVPGTVSRTEPIASWTAGQDPTLQSGWSYVEANNDPVYTFQNNYGVEDDQSFPFYTFDSFLLPNCTSSTQTLGILLYTLDNMNQASTADSIVFDRISLTPTSFAIDSNPITFNDELIRLQYYYEQSYKIGDLPGASSSDNAIFYQQWANIDGTNADLYLRGFTIQYKTIKRATPTLVLYNPTSLNANNTVAGFVFVDGSAAINGTSVAAPSTNWSTRNTSTKSVYYSANRSSAVLTSSTASTAQTEGFITFHYTANARLGA